MLVCPRCRGLVEPGSPICPTCAYDPHTGDTALNPPRPDTSGPEQSTLAIVLSGVSMLVAIVLVMFALAYAVRMLVIDRPSSDRTFTTESGTSPGNR